jgi:antitoxin (DNA-binding transcriptional repressor) of toxin-antitoxin stability system
MKTTTVRGLHIDTAKILSWVADGETVEVLCRNLPVAILSPPPSRSAEVPRPDFAGRLRAIYGDRSLRPTSTKLVSVARGST